LFSAERISAGKDIKDMKEKMKLLINDRDAAMEIALTGLETVLKRHTCVHRVDELLRICGELGIYKEAETKGEKNGFKRA
jgi:spore maturation protein CgeB